MILTRQRRMRTLHRKADPGSGIHSGTTAYNLSLANCFYGFNPHFGRGRQPESWSWPAARRSSGAGGIGVADFAGKRLCGNLVRFPTRSGRS